MIEVYQGVGLIDLLYIAQRAPEDEREQWRAMTGREWDADTVAAQLQQLAGPKFLLVRGEAPVSVGGFTEIRPGTWRDWMMNTPEAFAGANAIGVSRICRRVYDTMATEPDVRRLECVVLASRQKAMDWYRVLGLHFEGIEHRAGAGGENLARYARVRAA